MMNMVCTTQDFNLDQFVSCSRLQNDAGSFWGRSPESWHPKIVWWECLQVEICIQVTWLGGDITLFSRWKPTKPIQIPETRKPTSTNKKKINDRNKNNNNNNYNYNYNHYNYYYYFFLSSTTSSNLPARKRSFADCEKKSTAWALSVWILQLGRWNFEGQHFYKVGPYDSL